MPVPFEVGKVYNFETHAETLLGAQHKGCVILAIMDYGTALKERDVTASHHAVYGYLPDGTPDDPAATAYIRFKMPSGIISILGVSWIKADTIEEVDSGYINLRVSDIAPSDVTKLRDQLSLAGYSNFTIDYIPVSGGV